MTFYNLLKKYANKTKFLKVGQYELIIYYSEILLIKNIFFN